MRLYKLIGILFLFSIVLMPFSVLALGWSQEGGAGTWLGSNLIGRGMSSLYFPNTNTNTTYKKCVIGEGSLFEPVWIDIGGSTDIVISTASDISIYDQDCNFITSINGAYPSLAPTITDLDNDGNREITLISENMQYLRSWEYSQYSGGFSQIINFSLPYKPTGGFACGVNSVTYDQYLGRKCFISANSMHDQNYLYLNFTVIDFRSSLSSPTLGGDTNYNIRLTINPADTYYPAKFDQAYSDFSVYPDSSNSRAYIPITLGGIGVAQKTVFIIYYSDGGTYALFNASFGYGGFIGSSYGGGVSDRIINSHISMVNVRGSDVFIIDASAGDHSGGYGANTIVSSMYSKSGSYILQFYQFTNADPFPLYSNIMVGDYDKNGQNELCRLDYPGAKPTLYCYDSVGALLQAYNYSGVLDGKSFQGFSWVMGAFCNNSNNMGIAGAPGVFCSNDNSTGGINLLNDTGYYSTDYCGGARSLAHPATSCSPGSASQLSGNGQPIYAYATDSFTALYRNPSGQNLLCGDGVCDANYENAFTCPADCNGSSSGLSGCNVLNTSGNLFSCTYSAGGLCSADDLYYCPSGALYQACRYSDTNTWPVVNSSTTCESYSYYCVIGSSNVSNSGFVSCPNGCVNGQCLNVICNSGYQVCSDGIDFNKPYSNGSVYQCSANGQAWELVKSCTNPLIPCVEYSFNHSDCVNITNYTQVAYSVFNPGAACENDTQCVTNFCYNQKCDYKADFAPCSSYIECLSGKCTNGKCEKSNLDDKAIYGIKQTFGEGAVTFVLLLLLIAVISMLIYFGAVSGNTTALIGAIVLAVVIMNLGLLFFGIRGYISLWYFILAFMVELAVSFAAYMIFGRNTD